MHDTTGRRATEVAYIKLHQNLWKNSERS